MGEIIPDLIEVGFDVLYPLQPECHDVAEVVARYQKQMTFWGTISSQNYSSGQERRSGGRNQTQNASGLVAGQCDALSFEYHRP
ncbi:MAG: hypothetical protein ABDK87_07175 [Atribacterota bacterium]